ncbi:MAG: hypothetical protein WAL56_22920 [Candidatus Sulfotelmatobacter sp.]
MKALTLALFLSTTLSATFSLTSTTPVANPSQLARRPTGHLDQHSKSGRWYFAATGHAVYCYGPVMTLPQANGDIQKVATFCRDGQAVVPLKD